MFIQQTWCQDQSVPRPSMNASSLYIKWENLQTNPRVPVPCLYLNTENRQMHTVQPSGMSYATTSYRYPHFTKRCRFHLQGRWQITTTWTGTTVSLQRRFSYTPSGNGWRTQLNVRSHLASLTWHVWKYTNHSSCNASFPLALSSLLSTPFSFYPYFLPSSLFCFSFLQWKTCVLKLSVPTSSLICSDRTISIFKQKCSQSLQSSTCRRRQQVTQNS